MVLNWYQRFTLEGTDYYIFNINFYRNLPVSFGSHSFKFFSRFDFWVPGGLKKSFFNFSRFSTNLPFPWFSIVHQNYSRPFLFLVWSWRLCAIYWTFSRTRFGICYSQKSFRNYFECYVSILLPIFKSHFFLHALYHI